MSVSRHGYPQVTVNQEIKSKQKTEYQNIGLSHWHMRRLYWYSVTHLFMCQEDCNRNGGNKELP